MLPNLALLNQIQQRILSIPNQRKETKRREHYCCYLLCQKAGLRTSEAVNFDLNAKTQQGLYKITKTKGKKTRLAYIPKQVIRELKANNWQPNRTNRFNFYHFLKSIKKELGISQNVELTPHTLRRAFATFNAEKGLPLPLLSKLLGHKSVRTTALYWMNTYHPDDDDNNDTSAILCGKNWIENQEKEPKQPYPTPLISEIPPYPNRISLLIEPAKPKIDELTNALSKKDQEIEKLTTEKKALQSDLEDLNEQNTALRQAKARETTEKEQIQQNLSIAKETIQQLKQALTNEREQKTITQNNLAQEKAFSHSQQQTINDLRQQLHAEQANNQSLKEINANLTQKLSNQEQILPTSKMLIKSRLKIKN